MVVELKAAQCVDHKRLQVLLLEIIWPSTIFLHARA